MSSGILICGANGSGKTTLGSELAKALNYKHMDIEDEKTEKWIKTLSCTIIEADGTNDIANNVKSLVKKYHQIIKSKNNRI